MDKELYDRLGTSKCQELTKRSDVLWVMLSTSENRKSAQVVGMVSEGIARDFIREILPPGFGLKSGLIFYAQNKRMSPQIDAIIYKGVPLLEFSDVVVVEKEQVKAIFEIKHWVDQPNLFGSLQKDKKIRDPETGLKSDFERKRHFLPQPAKYVLFAFNLSSASSDDEVINRLKEICDIYAIVRRWKPGGKRLQGGKEPWFYNFDYSVSRLFEWVRNLS